MRVQVQRFGKFLSGMIMPNIGAFIAWGFITALFIPSGWLPNEKLALLVSPMLRYLLPLLIAYSGGKMVYGDKGGIMGAIATMGVITGSDIPMFIGAMAIGPLSGWVIKRFDQLVEGKIPAGFEMLTNNFSVGILGMLCAIIGFYTISPVVAFLTHMLSSGVEIIMSRSLLPFVSFFIEPAKVLFLNNAINHGILTPIGLEQSQAAGSSIMFLLEANPGSGLGVLTAYWIFSKGSMQSSAPGAIVIHFLGGIHEIYFPYILARPFLIIAPMLGSASAILVYSIFGGGLVVPASPGSIISLMAMSPKSGAGVVILGVLTATVVSFLISWAVIKKTSEKEEDDTTSVQDKGHLHTEQSTIRRVVFACDAGMGSSAMGATRLRRKLEKSGVHINVTNSSVDHIPAGTDVVVCQSELSHRAQQSSPLSELIVIKNFLSDPALDNLFARLSDQPQLDNREELFPGEKDTTDNSILTPENIVTGLRSTSKQEAIRRAGELLQARGYVKPGYVGAMLEREELVTTYLGMGVAIPHGTSEAKNEIIQTGVVVMQYPEGVLFGEEKARLVIGIAASGDRHIDILARLSGSLEDEAVLEELFTTPDKRFILETFGLNTKNEN